MSDSSLPSITVFALGGTIAAVVDRDGRNASMHLTGDDIVSSVPALAAVASVTAETFRTIPSASLTLDDLIELARAIDGAVEGGADGVVVTQGTDTMEETAWLLDLLVRSDAPVVVTGAMRNVGKPGADGPANLLGAVTVASSPLASGVGTLVVMNDEIHLARFVQKTHSSAPSTFRSPAAGPVGWINEGRVRIPLVPRVRTPRFTGSGTGERVALVRLVLDDDGGLLDAVEGRYAGLVVEVLGGGHVPAWLVDRLRDLARVIPVVFSSRTGAGELYTSTGDFPGSERSLLEAGLISAGALDGLKARLLLTLLVRSGLDTDGIRAAFSELAETG